MWKCSLCLTPNDMPINFGNLTLVKPVLNSGDSQMCN